MINIPTAHINAKLNEIEKTVIMPGDPLRAKFIAKNYLENVKLVNNIRGILAYSGTYKSKPVTIMASGMGNPSMGIYSYELFKFYNVENIIRVGTCGAILKDTKLNDMIIIENSITKTNYANLNEKGIHVLKSSKKLANLAKNKAKSLNFCAFLGNIYCSDTFYNEENQQQIIKENNCLGVEMETASLYYNAKTLNKNAIAICSVSNNLITGQELSAKQRETGFENMIKLALEMI